MFTILIVDDTRENIKVLASFLLEKYNVVTARSGEKALDILKRRPVDLILLDVLMPPGMNGFETCEKIKQDNDIADVPVIFITALNDAESLDNSFKVGGVDYIAKPFRHKEVLARVKVHIEHFSMVNARQQMIEGLEEVVKYRDMAFANMSHELRTPLNAIIGFSEMISDDINEGGIEHSEIKNDLNSITKSGHYLLKLVNGILDISKLQADRMDIMLTTFLILDVLEEAIMMCEKISKKNKNTLKIGNAVNLNVIADRARVLQIILNLLSNACKFTCNGDITVHTTVNTAYLHIIISDTGCGMSENEQQRLFKPFSQANQNINAEYGGTGLGLALSKKLAELMNGGISMQSRVGKGSDFILILPLATS